MNRTSTRCTTSSARRSSTRRVRVARRTGFALAASAALIALTGCSSSGPAPAESPASSSEPAAGPISVVASTDVYGSIAAAIGGDVVTVTSIIDNPNQDPHEFEADARSQLALSKAQVVIENGGGYDDFIDTMLSALGDRAHVTSHDVLNVTALSGLDHTPATFNEHLWYDWPTMRKLADALAERLAQLEPGHADAVRGNADRFADALDVLEHDAEQLRRDHGGEGVLVTEPVPLYLTAAAGLVDRTSPRFLEAVEEGADVPPTVLHDTIAGLTPQSVRVVIDNPQTSSPQTDQVLAAARAAGIPVVAMTETLPAGADYLSWMRGNLRELAAALGETTS